jgi:hypothetical protein
MAATGARDARGAKRSRSGKGAFGDLSLAGDATYDARFARGVVPTTPS